MLSVICGRAYTNEENEHLLTCWPVYADFISYVILLAAPRSVYHSMGRFHLMTPLTKKSSRDLYLYIICWCEWFAGQGSRLNNSVCRQQLVNYLLFILFKFCFVNLNINFQWRSHFQRLDYVIACNLGLFVWKLRQKCMFRSLEEASTNNICCTAQRCKGELQYARERILACT